MPARRRYVGEAIRFAGGEALLGRGLSVVILSAELGLLYTWEGERAGQVLGPLGTTMTRGRAAEMAQDGAAAGAFLHSHLVGSGEEERPPYRKVLVGGSTLHQEVVEAWERAGVFRGAEMLYLPEGDPAQRNALAALYGISPAPASGHRAPSQLPLL